MAGFPTDTYIDGGGVLKDQPLPEGSWIRLVLDPDDRQRDITVCLRNGEVRVSGQYRPLVVRQVQPNTLTVTTAETP